MAASTAIQLPNDEWLKVGTAWFSRCDIRCVPRAAGRLSDVGTPRQRNAVPNR